MSDQGHNELREAMEFETAENKRRAASLSLKSHAIIAVAGLAGLAAITVDGLTFKVAALVGGVGVVIKMAFKEAKD